MPSAANPLIASGESTGEFSISFSTPRARFGYLPIEALHWLPQVGRHALRDAQAHHTARRAPEQRTIQWRRGARQCAESAQPG